MKVLDCIVVGSGPSGTIAAKTLVDAGVDVTLINVGFKPEQKASMPADKKLLALRKSDNDQYKYIIGEYGQGLAWGDVAGGAQITPPRQYMIKDVQELMPTESKNFFPIQSLGYGGLGISWGLQCWEYSTTDLEKMGLDAAKIKSGYDEVSKIIGVSATNDDASKYTIGDLNHFQPSVSADRNHQLILNSYSKKRKKLQKQGVYVGRTPLAIITKPTKTRKAYRYLETDFYSDADKSAWRPWITLDELRSKNNFHYIDGKLALSFKESDNITTLEVFDVNTGEKAWYSCRKLILAGGAMGSARIVMRSMGPKKGIGTRRPILSNPHSYVPAIQPTFFGKGYEDKKLNMGQVSYFIDKQGNDTELSVASSYGYQSLLLFRIISQIPFNFSDGRLLTRFVLPGLIVMILQHPDYQSDSKYIELVEDSASPSGDKLKIEYKLSAKDESKWEEREKQIMKLMPKLWTFPVKKVKTEHGSGIHYAGTLPFSEKSQNLSLDQSGKLHKTKNVFVADSSGFKYLPGKGLTFTIMANAFNVANNVAKELNEE